MDIELIVFWNICLVGVIGLALTLKRARMAGYGWSGLYAATLLVDLAGYFARQRFLIFGAAAMWLVFALGPALLWKKFQRHYLAQRYDLAGRWARVISWLHPMDGWRQQPEILHALELAQRGELPAALLILERYKHLKSMIGIAAILQFCRITQRWNDLLAWEAETKPNLVKQPDLLPHLLRARGEIGDVKGMVALYEQFRGPISNLKPPTSRDMCRLVLFAFCGKAVETERLLAGSLAQLASPIRSFWVATADLYAGNFDACKSKLEALYPAADASFRLAIERRLAQLPRSPAVLDAREQAVLDAREQAVIVAAAQEQHHDESFGTQRTLFSRAALATQILMVLNLIMFGLEIGFGGSENFETIYRLGAMHGPTIMAGQWWRLVSSMFLHFGVLHLAMNMFALWVLGPSVEYALGFFRYLFVYFAAGIGSMAVVLVLSLHRNPDQLMAGASGAIMGMIGATGALMLRGWLRHQATAAKRRLGGMVLILGLQVVFDAAIPEVSMTAHLSGVALGFLATLPIRDRSRSAS